MRSLILGCGQTPYSWPACVRWNRAPTPSRQWRRPRTGEVLGSAVLLFLVLRPDEVGARAQTKPVTVVAKWGRFEQSFKSSVVYSNALQDAKLTAVFTSPLGETNRVDGFWDGGKVWRVRFSPDQPGRWSYRTACSDRENKGLDNQAGAFICTAATGQTRFNRHGPVRVARDRRHLEHADGTPFFWLADTIWNGARAAEPKDFELYARVRASQNFTVAQWSVAPGEDDKKQAAFTGQDPVAINPQFFKRLEDKIETLSRAGILSAISPFADLGAGNKGAQALPEYQAAVLFRYMVARWGAEPVAWVLALEDESQAKEASRWKKVGQAVFREGQHAPVMLYAGASPQFLDEFREENWVDIFGYRTVTGTRDAIKGSLTESPANEWQREPARPLICFTPCENGVAPQSAKRFSSDEVRQAAYGSLFADVPAGISYEAQGVVDWDESHPTKGKVFEQLPGWHKALFMPAAKQMAHLGKFIDSIDFWRLRPEPKFIAAPPADGSPSRHAAALATEPNEMALVYVPEERTLELFMEALPPSPNITWLNPRTGENSPAVAVVGGRTCQFPTPDPGDWLLVMKAGKQ